jgi:hypothetical protein
MLREVTLFRPDSIQCQLPTHKRITVVWPGASVHFLNPGGTEYAIVTQVLTLSISAATALRLGLGVRLAIVWCSNMMADTQKLHKLRKTKILTRVLGAITLFPASVIKDIVLMRHVCGLRCVDARTCSHNSGRDPAHHAVTSPDEYKTAFRVDGFISRYAEAR